MDDGGLAQLQRETSGPVDPESKLRIAQAVGIEIDWPLPSKLYNRLIDISIKLRIIKRQGVRLDSPALEQVVGLLYRLEQEHGLKFGAAYFGLGNEKEVTRGTLSSIRQARFTIGGLEGRAATPDMVYVTSTVGSRLDKELAYCK